MFSRLNHSSLWVTVKRYCNTARIPMGLNCHVVKISHLSLLILHPQIRRGLSSTATPAATPPSACSELLVRSRWPTHSFITMSLPRLRWKKQDEKETLNFPNTDSLGSIIRSSSLSPDRKREVHTWRRLRRLPARWGSWSPAGVRLFWAGCSAPGLGGFYPSRCRPFAPCCLWPPPEPGRVPSCKGCFLEGKKKVCK